MVDFALIQKIRTHINKTEKQTQLLTNRKKWMRVTSALDVLEDTSCAVLYYVENPYPEDIKGKYLFTYGLLQSLFVQLDAVNSIHNVFHNKDIAFKTEYPDAYNVREMRDDVTGHPTFRRNHQFIHLAQISMEKDTFYYLKYDAKEEKDNIIHVNISKSIGDVAKCVNSILEDNIRMLNKEFEEYINAHKDRKMKHIFNGLYYAKEKTLSKNLYDMSGGYSSTKQMVSKCEEELILRYGSVDTVDEYRYLLTEIHDLYELIDNGLTTISTDLQSRLRKYLLQHLFVKLSQLEEYAEETDSYFENYGKEPEVELSNSVTITVKAGNE